MNFVGRPRPKPHNACSSPSSLATRTRICTSTACSASSSQAQRSPSPGCRGSRASTRTPEERNSMFWTGPSKVLPATTPSWVRRSFLSTIRLSPLCLSPRRSASWPSGVSVSSSEPVAGSRSSCFVVRPPLWAHYARHSRSAARSEAVLILDCKTRNSDGSRPQRATPENKNNSRGPKAQCSSQPWATPKEQGPSVRAIGRAFSPYSVFAALPWGVAHRLG